MTRRTLLVGSAAAAAAHALGQESSQERKVGWAMLGLGGYATRQLMPALRNAKRSKLVALVSGTPAKLERFGAEYGIPESHRYSYDNLDKIKENPDIEVVYIVTPPGNHRTFTERAAAAGKHVCCEKPMAPTVADCQAMIDACRKAGKKLQIGYRSHYQPHNLRAMRACREGEVGVLRSITSDHGFNMPNGTWRTQRRWSGGGSMMDIGIYAVQAICYLAGADPTEVVARISNLPDDPRYKEVEDTCHFELAFPSGVLGSGASGYSWQSGANRYRVIGSRGTLSAEPATGYWGHRLEINGKVYDAPDVNQFAAQMDHFSDAILKNEAVRTPGEMGLRDIRIIQACYESARTRQPVSLKS